MKTNQTKLKTSCHSVSLPAPFSLLTPLTMPPPPQHSSLKYRTELCIIRICVRVCPLGWRVLNSSASTMRKYFYFAYSISFSLSLFSSSSLSLSYSFCTCLCTRYTLLLSLFRFNMLQLLQIILITRSFYSPIGIR